MKVIVAVQLHPTGRYPIAVDWIDVADEGDIDWDLAAPRHRASAQEVFNELQRGARVSTIFPNGAGFLAGQDVEAVHQSGVATFTLGPPRLRGRALTDLKQFE